MQAPGSDAICVVRNRIGSGGAGFGFGSVCLGPGSGSVRFLQARSGFGSDLSAQFGFGSESDRFGIGMDSTPKTGAMAMRNADAMAVEIQLFYMRCGKGLVRFIISSRASTLSFTVAKSPMVR